MKDNETQKNMDREIKKRIESNSWDVMISKNVLKTWKTKRKNIFTAALIPIAAAALIIFIFFPGDPTPPQRITLDQFITSQVEGTFKRVFKDYYKYSHSTPDESEGIISDNIDMLIDNTLAMR